MEKLSVLQYAGRLVSAPFTLPSLRERQSNLVELTPDTLQVMGILWLPALLSVSKWEFSWGIDGSQPEMLLSHVPGPPLSFRLRFPGQCDFLINAATGRIGIEAVEGISAETIEHLLLDQALPRVIAQQGNLVVHASCVAISGEAVLFVGRSGWGKSTLAALFHRMGHPSLCDDCTVLDVRSGSAWAIPAYPGLRLYDDSVEQAFEERPKVSAVSDYSCKRRIALTTSENSAGQALRLRRIFVLGDPAQHVGPPVILPMTAADACMALLEHSFRLDPSSREGSGRLLQLAARFARTVPVYSLRFEHDFSQKAQILRSLLAHLTHDD